MAQSMRDEPGTQREFETIFILRPDTNQDGIQLVNTRVKGVIEQLGGRVIKLDNWGKRKLAYEVKHQKEGSYVLQDFQIGPDRVPELEAALKITEEVLRHLIVRKPEKVAVPPVPPPPAEVVLEPIALESDVVAEPAGRADREEES